MIAYRYTIGNTSIETLDLTTIPNGVDYETFEVLLEEVALINQQLTNEQLLLKVQLLETEINQIKQQLNENQTTEPEI
jgi:hypothetical protein